ncbi:hypothetical protein GUJ93_ZPchr0011g28941 [Zizania palustris]|uniref:Uncharacterized protein n=1 Tax=Zizania palustris TaxID=103762 RepID=A0A8J5WLP9_ZIZPA|nr:hypothetical protein GUJ93_ZPchr0011g28941 [Zizania palustris]
MALIAKVDAMSGLGEKVEGIDLIHEKLMQMDFKLELQRERMNQMQTMDWKEIGEFLINTSDVGCHPKWICPNLMMPVYQVHSFCRHFEGFIRELRMMVTFLGFLFEPEFHGVYMEEFAGPCDVSLTIHGSSDHLPFFMAALGGPTFDVACQHITLQALMELRMIYDDRLQNSSFRLVPKRTPSTHRSIYIRVHSDRDPVMARQTRLLQAMDDLHTEAVLNAEEHHEAVEFLRQETKSLIQQNGELQRKII